MEEGYAQTKNLLAAAGDLHLAATAPMRPCSIGLMTVPPLARHYLPPEVLLTIDDYRKEINRLDSELLRIFNARAALALKIGEIKKERGIPVYDPEREKRIFETMSQMNPGPLEDEAIVRLFERVIDESRRLERLRTKGI